MTSGIHPVLASLLLTAAGAGTRAQQPALPKSSPFLPAAGQPSAVTSAASETIEFAGVSSVGKRTDLIFHDKTKKKSHWIGLGETKEGIAVLNYDAGREEAVVKLNGVEKVLPLRKGTGAGKGPAVPGSPGPAVPALAAPAPAPPLVMVPPVPVPTAEPAAPAAAPTPASPPSPAEVQRRQETEARMLVSDLLEIGMAQRKAYEDAQRKAAEGGTTTPPPSPPAEEPKQP